MKLKIFLILFFIPLQAYADQPPDWRNFKVTSANGKWNAFVGRDYNEGAKYPWEDTWTLSVYKAFRYPIPTPSEIPIWSRPYDPSGYAGGYLSDDGKVFVYVEYWYHKDRPVVKIFREDCKIFKDGNFFKVGKNLKKTVSHELWLGKGKVLQFVSLEGEPHIEISTVSGVRYVNTVCEKSTN
ncbi:hypothetical protein [uncultured Microbulbifer sp.]|uniref:hypothetical protein n=1 Tax=uncultured Microbulbifer sp. TaxID=348147 RepID=UPI00261E7B05|nr:hypothetical protein [uncultured Microbulbifer sp.]